MGVERERIRPDAIGSRFILRGSLVVVTAAALYVAAYLLLCLRTGEDTDRYGGTGEPLFLRGYRWSWCETAFVPAAYLEGICRSRRVVLIADRDWCPHPWWAWWPLDD